MSDKRHLSHSQLDMLSRCGQQYVYRYLEKLIAPPGIAMARGTAVHRAAEVNWRQKLESKVDLPRLDLQDIAAESFNAAIAGGVQVDESAGVPINDQIGKAKDAAVAMADVLATNIAPRHQPVVVEQKFAIPLTPALDFIGFIDMANDQKQVIDLKTSAAKWSQQDADVSLQLSAYAAGYKSEFGEYPSSLAIENIALSAKGPVSQTLVTNRDESDIDVLAARVDAAERVIAAGAFVPASPDDWCCSAKWCGYWSICPYAMRPKNNG